MVGDEINRHEEPYDPQSDRDGDSQIGWFELGVSTPFKNGNEPDIIENHQDLNQDSQ